MIEVSLPESVAPSEATTFAACLATILELPYEEVPTAGADEDVAGWRTMRWLGGRGLGLVPIARPDKFSWAGPWIGVVRPEPGGVAVEWLRQVVSPSGSLTERRHTQMLDSLGPDELEDEAAEHGLRAVERREIDATELYIGSMVVICRR